MSTQEHPVHPPVAHKSHHEHGAGVPVVGFIISIVLTLIALWAVMNHVLGVRGLIVLIIVLAVVQIAVQLFFFMHVTESRGHPWHAWMLGLGFAFVIAIVAGSMWIMAFGAPIG